jgi:hypothetical protein
MSKRILYHGSSEIIQAPLFGKGKSYKEFGKGFYCTEHAELAKEWACSKSIDGYVNMYEMNTDNLLVLNLLQDEYTILHWLALLMEYRKFRISTPVMKRGDDWLKEQFLIDLTGYDVVIGYRADDSYFSFARAFVNNEISLTQLSYAMKLGELGEQYVLKSPAAFEKIQFISYEAVDNTEYYPKRKIRDEKARAAFRKELERDDLEGLYMRDILKEKVQPNDPRLR